jgi:hypothetical protein
VQNEEKEKRTLQLDTAKADRRMPHLANGNYTLYTSHLKSAPNPLLRAGKIVIYANSGLSQITLFGTGRLFKFLRNNQMLKTKL